jgi:hypothetical protein
MWTARAAGSHGAFGRTFAKTTVNAFCSVALQATAGSALATEAFCSTLEVALSERSTSPLLRRQAALRSGIKRCQSILKELGTSTRFKVALLHGSERRARNEETCVAWRSGSESAD